MSEDSIREDYPRIISKHVENTVLKDTGTSALRTREDYPRTMSKNDDS